MIQPGTGASPYPGIRPFREDEEYLFFGREAQVDALVDTLARQRFLAVIGSSGCGKSSLVNCGLRPALHRGLLTRAGSRWRMATCRPGAEPLRALAQALAQPGALLQGAPADGGFFSPAELIESTLAMGRTGLVDAWQQARLPQGSNLLLVVDQFEELFRYQGLHTRPHDEGDPGVAFVNLLLEARRQEVPIYIVLTMRSDFLGDCARFTGLPEAINQGQYLVPRMSRDERRAAIQGPARVFGSDLAPPLLTRLVNDVGDDPDQLSLLQHALARTWAHWQASGDPAPIEAHHYDAIGTLAGALNQHAEELFAGLGAEGQTDCGWVFRCLTDKSTDSRGIRRPTRFADLGAITGLGRPRLERVLAPFRAPGAAFLMPPEGDPLQADTVIDLAHESLMRIWHRLRDWGEEEAEAARMLRRLADAAELHHRGQASLWRDPELQFAQDWRHLYQPTPPWAAQYGRTLEPALAFLDASVAARDATQAAERARIQAEQTSHATQARQRRVLRLTLGIICATTLVAGATGFLWLRAERASQQALSRQLAAQSSTELVDQQLPEALLLAAQAWHTAPTDEARDSLLASLNRAPEHWSRAHQDGILALATHPTGRLLASGGRDGSILLWRQGDEHPIARLQGHAHGVQALAFSPDGQTLASGGTEGQLILWDLTELQPRVAALTDHQGPIHALAYSPDGRLASAGADQKILIRDGRTGAPIAPPLAGHQDVITGLRFSPDGALLASVGYDGLLLLWRMPAHAPLPEHPIRQATHPAILHDVVFSPDGRTLVIASADRTIRRLNTEDLSPEGSPLIGHEGPVRALLFSTNGRHLYSAGQDRQVLDWDMLHPEAPPHPLTSHGGVVSSLSPGQDAEHLVSAGEDDLLSWTTTTHQGLHSQRLAARLETAWALAWRPDGAQLALADAKGRIRLLDPRQPTSGDVRVLPAVHTALITRLAWTPHGQALLSAGQDGRLLSWTPTQDGPPRTLYQGKPLLDLAPAPTGDEWALIESPGHLRVWRQGRITTPMPEHTWQSVSYGQAGLAAASRSGLVQTWGPDGQAGPSLQLDGPVLQLSWAGDTVLLATQQHGLLRWQPGQAQARPLSQDKWLIQALATSPDGQMLAGIDLNGLVHLWDLKNAQMLREPLARHQGPGLALAWSPDGRQLVSSAWKDEILLHRTAPAGWAELACKMVQRNPPGNATNCDAVHSK